MDAFIAACSPTCPLNPSSMSNEGEKEEFAKGLFDCGDHKSSIDYDCPWLTACHAALSEAHATALMARENVKKPVLTKMISPSREGYIIFDDLSRKLEISLYALGFVTMKVSFLHKVVERRNNHAQGYSALSLV